MEFFLWDVEELTFLIISTSMSQITNTSSYGQMLFEYFKRLTEKHYAETLNNDIWYTNEPGVWISRLATL